MTWPASPAPHDPREGGGESEDPTSPTALAAVVVRAQHASDALQPDAPGPVVVLPPDLDVEDRVLGPLTARQLGYAAVGAAGLAVMVLAPWPTRPVGLVLVAIGLAGVLLRPDGLSIEVWLGHVLAYRRRVRTQARHVRDGHERRTREEVDPTAHLDDLDDLAHHPARAEAAECVVAVGHDREPTAQGAPDEQGPLLAEVAALDEAIGAVEAVGTQVHARTQILDGAQPQSWRRPAALLAAGLLLVSVVAGALELRDVIGPASSVEAVPRSGTAAGSTEAPSSPAPSAAATGPSGSFGPATPGAGLNPQTAGPQPFPSMTGTDLDALLEELLTALDP